MTRSNSELERVQKRTQGGRSLHQREILSDANARSSAERQINGHIDCRSGADLLVTEPDIAPRGPDDQCRGRIEAHRFLDYLIRINEGVDMAWTNGTTSGSHGNLPPNPALDFRMNAQQI